MALVQNYFEVKASLPDSPVRYLVRTDALERKKWAERAIELGCPPDSVKASSIRIIDLLQWSKYVADEMLQQGLWEPKPEPEQPAKVITLPTWPDAVRGIPNDILRSALFPAIQGKTRRFLRKEIIASISGVKIMFTGMQFDQADLDVWEYAVHLARTQPLGNVCQFQAGTFLKAIGRNTGKSQYEWLDESIDRLIACAVKIRNGDKIFIGNLLSSCIKDENTKVYSLRLNPDTIKLYLPSDWSSIDWNQRQSLTGKPLALWLHSFYSSHAEPFPMKVETIRELCGSNTNELYRFRAALRQALDDLKVCGALADWRIDSESDLVFVDRGLAMTGSQQRHIKKKPKKPNA